MARLVTSSCPGASRKLCGRSVVNRCASVHSAEAVIGSPVRPGVPRVFKTRKPPPEQPPSLRQMIRSIAQLGGFLARKSDGEPGTPSLVARPPATGWPARGSVMPQSWPCRRPENIIIRGA